MPYGPFGRGPIYTTVASAVAVAALIVGVLLPGHHKDGRGVIFIVAALAAVAVAVLARPR